MDDLPIYMKYSLQGIDFLWSYSIRTLERGFEKKLAWWTINLLVWLFLKTLVSGKRIAWEVMLRRYDSEYDSPDASKHGFKTMGMISGHIRGMIRGYDSRQCNMPVVIHSVYAILGNYRIVYAAAMVFKIIIHVLHFRLLVFLLIAANASPSAKFKSETNYLHAGMV